MIDDIFAQHHAAMDAKVKEARKKYDPLVARLTDAEFVAIFQAVVEERTVRLARLIATNPIVRQMAVDRLNQQLKEKEDHGSTDARFPREGGSPG